MSGWFNSCPIAPRKQICLRSRADTPTAEGLLRWAVTFRVGVVIAAGCPFFTDVAVVFELAAEALARLSVGGVHQLCGLLKAERDELRELEDGRSADSLTSAIRDLDSRTQILDDLLR